MTRYLPIPILILLILGSCTNQSEPIENTTRVPPAANSDGEAASSGAPQTPEEPQEEPMSVEELQNTIVDLNTSKGTISIRFFPDIAPNHVRNFVELAKTGFYDGTKFHRIIPGFMIQGGDPNTKSDNHSTWGTGGSGKNLKAEFNATPHHRGIVSMARSNHPDSASSQFFIVVAESRFLDNNYTVFGEVISGMEVADQIVSAPKNAQDRPLEPVAIESVEVRSADSPAS